MRLLVTGGTGHIGSRLLPAAIANSAISRVTVLDDLSTQRWSSLLNLPTRSFDLLIARVQDVTDPSFLSQFDVILHLAATTDAEGSVSNPELTMRNNVGATKALVEAAMGSAARLIHASSTSVYGSQDSMVDEECTELFPQSPYALGKLEEEAIIRSARAQGLWATSLRMGTIVGTSPGMRFHTAVNKFCLQATLGEPLTVWRSVRDQVRPYLAIDDAIRAMLHIAGLDAVPPVLNVATENLSVNQILESVQQRIPLVEISETDSPIMNQLSYGVRTNAIEVTGFEFQGSIDSAIGETLGVLSGFLSDSDQPGSR